MHDLCDAAGEALSSRWTMAGLLGRGHSAKIFVAHDVHGQAAPVALKLAKYETGMNWQRVVTTFEREAELLRRCNHPNVVELLGTYRSATSIALLLSLEAACVPLRVVLLGGLEAARHRVVQRI